VYLIRRINADKQRWATKAKCHEAKTFSSIIIESAMTDIMAWKNLGIRINSLERLRN